LSIEEVEQLKNIIANKKDNLCRVVIFIAANVQGLAMLGQQRFVTPELKPNIVGIVDCDYKC
jgi:hypothetical protein